MESEPRDTKLVTFKYDIKEGNLNNSSFEINIEVPYFGCSEGICERLFKEKKIPIHLHKGIIRAFRMFVERENENYFDSITFDLLSSYMTGDYTFKHITELWESTLLKNNDDNGKEKLVTDDSELFSTVYHKLVHSPALETILQVENSYSLETQEIIQARDHDLAELSTKQTEEMCKAVEGLSLGLTEADITAIASRHLEEHGIQIASWQSKLAGLRDSQRSAYREWLMSLLEQSYNSNVPLTPNTPSAQLGYHSNRGAEIHHIPFQESFTIHLGSQMKQMYNIRLMVADVLNFCRQHLTSGGELDPQPQRLQTSLGLYSSDLCGLVLLSDNHLGGFSGITKDFIKICETSTELHFKSIEEQIEDIRELVKEAINWRKSNKTVDGLTSIEQQSRKSSTRYLQTGDFFITKHSNLSEVHVVYHIVVDDTVKSNEITSRNPVILGLRNILKSACSYDVTTLTLPVLLTHEINDEMTMAWCIKRAELVFKCIKGFMIEMASWGGSEIKNLQLLLPQGLSEEIFTSLASMLPCIFRLSNPLVLKDSSSK